MNLYRASNIRDEEDLISQLSHVPPEADTGMISITNPPSLSQLPHNRESSAGNLDKLPAELMQYILEQLDFRALSYLSQASLRGHEIVHANSSYENTMRYAQETLVALSRTKLITYHSVALIRRALFSSECVSCREFGAYLFLPTCQRCCWQCLDYNPSLWVTKPTIAAECFSLSHHQLAKLPKMRVIPGIYNMWHGEKTLKRPTKLISIRDAKKLALEMHGSQDELRRRMHMLADLSPAKEAEYSFYQGAPLAALNKDPLDCRRGHIVKVDPFGGMASIQFPSLSSGDADYGIWCRGCEWVYAARYDPAFVDEVRSIVPESAECMDYLLGLRRRAKSRPHFITRHIKQCIGIRNLLSREEAERWLDS